MKRTDMASEQKGEPDYACKKHCKLCPFPGYKCHGRPTKLNYENPASPFTQLVAAKNSAP